MKSSINKKDAEIEFRSWKITKINKKDAEIEFEIKTNSEWFAKNQCEELIKQEGYLLNSTIKCQRTFKHIPTLRPKTYSIYTCYAKAHRKR